VESLGGPYLVLPSPFSSSPGSSQSFPPSTQSPQGSEKHPRSPHYLLNLISLPARDWLSGRPGSLTLSFYLPRDLPTTSPGDLEEQDWGTSASLLLLSWPSFQPQAANGGYIPAAMGFSQWGFHI
jgi:hypothetical protein